MGSTVGHLVVGSADVMVGKFEGWVDVGEKVVGKEDGK